MRDILNRLGYRLKRIQKARPLKKTKDTDAVFDNVEAAREQYQDDPETLEISIDTKAKVNEGDYSRGGKGRTDSEGQTQKGWDHDPPAETKWTPFGILMLATGALTLIFTSAGDERLLGGRAEAVVAVGQGQAGARQAAGDLPGQRAEERGDQDAVAEADDRVRGLESGWRYGWCTTRRTTASTTR